MTEFPLDPAITFLNHGSFGSCPRPVLEVQHRLRERVESNPITFLLDEAEPLLDASRAELGRLVGADPDGLAFVTNATTGVNTVLRSLRFGAGDRILILGLAYNACANAARAVAAESGATVDVADVPFPIADPADAVEAVLRAVTDRTRLVLLDHVTSGTALVLPIEPLVRELEHRGIPVLVDGAHAPGMVPLDIDGLGASFYTGNCHKWLCAPKGAGFLHVRADHRERVHPLVVSHGANLRRPGRQPFHDEFDWCGTFDPTPWLCVGEAIRYMADTFGGWPAIMAANRALALAGRDLLVEALGVSKPAPDSMIGSMAAVPLPPSDEPGTGNRYMPHALQVRLRKNHGIEVPIGTWPAPPHRLVRISMQRYNSLDDVRRLVTALGEELR